MLELSEERKALLGTEGHILVMGGPGSGKTTIALLKADNCISQKVLKKHQKILFLSFARATVNQVEQVARKFISKDCMASVEINTYHGFAWSLLKGQSYLMNGQKLVRLITPSEASVRFAGINAATRTAEIVRLFHEEVFFISIYSLRKPQTCFLEAKLWRKLYVAHTQLLFWMNSKIPTYLNGG